MILVELTLGDIDGSSLKSLKCTSDGTSVENLDEVILIDFDGNALGTTEGIADW